MRLSRRTFLQLSSAALLNVSFNSHARFFESFTSTDATYGRAFGVVPVRSASGREVGRLWPNQVVRLLDAVDERYRIEGGYVQRTDLQPMMPIPPAVELPPAPFRAEVVGSHAVLRKACTVEAHIVASIGHGAVAYIIDQMPDANGGDEWLEVQLDDSLQRGWTQASNWRALETYESPIMEWTTVELDQGAFVLTARNDDATLLTAPFATGKRLTPGDYPVSLVAWGGEYGGNQGAAFPLVAIGLDPIVGAYWHNRFGAFVEGAGIEVAPVVAKWLAREIGSPAEIVVR